MEDEGNMIYGMTIDGLAAGAWCTDVGWAIQRIYSGCRRGLEVLWRCVSQLVSLSLEFLVFFLSSFVSYPLVASLSSF